MTSSDATALRRHHRPALSPVLVAAARDALLRRNARISSATASSLQLSVYSHLRMIQLNQLQAQNAAVAAATAAAHNHQQQLQQPQEAERQRQCPRHEEVKQDQQQQQQGFKGRKTSRSVLVLTSSHNMSTTSISTTAAATTATAAATSISTASNPGVGSSFTPTSSCSPLDSSGESGEREETADAAPLAATATRRKRGRRRRERADESCINSCSGAAAIASATDAVVRVLRVEQEWLVEALALRVDVCLWLSDGRQVVVEVDGPSHYFANLLRTQRPKTALRNRQLSRVFGAENVKCVPYWEWEVTAGVEARTAYLSRLLGLRGPE
ncbi:hypothetical protein Vafri_9685 [Volvox africanus]|uniref:RAP domain-containing protein n=1 Tax=Volvox africanus TaxID=51714 RepID=A0A8J4B4U9_9CHLO|nr:hypothetical protein Vafri_9685 [Volvox africanus]